MTSIYTEKADRIKNNSIESILFRIFDQSFVQEWIIDTVRDRIKFKGVDSFGDMMRTDTARKGFTNLGFYSSFTERLNKESGKSNTHVSLSDSGKFMNSWKLETKKKFAIMKANFKKAGNHIGDNFSDSYGTTKMFEQVILSLSPKEFITLNFEIILPRLLQILKNDVY